MSHVQVFVDGLVVYDNAQVAVVPVPTPVIGTPVPTPVPHVDTPPPAPQPSTGNPMLDAYRDSNPVGADTGTTGGGGQGYTGYELTPGNPKINEAFAGVYAVYTFTIPDGRATRVYYQQPGAADSGMKVTSFVLRSGVAVSPTETRVLSNKQPFDVQGPGSFEFHVMPEKTGPLSVGLE